jgi:hypothetical protein
MTSFEGRDQHAYVRARSQGGVPGRCRELPGFAVVNGLLMAPRSQRNHVHSDPVWTELAGSAFAHADHRRLSSGGGSRRVCGPHIRGADAVSAGEVGASAARPIVPVSRVKPSTVASW